MNEEQRRAEFDRIFDALPGRNIEKIRKVCSILHIEENTVRIYRLKTHSARIIPERQLMVLIDALDSEKQKTA